MRSLVFVRPFGNCTAGAAQLQVRGHLLAGRSAADSLMPLKVT